MTLRVMVLAGSLRKASLNKKLATAMAAELDTVGADVRHLDLADFRLPVYDGDLEDEQGVPEAAQRLGDEMRAADAIVFVCPEYNSSISAPLKNAIDWVSRPVGEVSGSSAFRDKLVMLLAASPGALGGLRGLVHVRAVLGHMGCIVLPDQYALAKADAAFDANGGLSDEKARARVAKLAQRLVDAGRRWSE